MGPMVLVDDALGSFRFVAIFSYLSKCSCSYFIGVCGVEMIMVLDPSSSDRMELWLHLVQCLALCRI